MPTLFIVDDLDCVFTGIHADITKIVDGIFGAGAPKRFVSVVGGARATSR